MSVRGFAIKRNGEIDVGTISTTETAAKGKWLVRLGETFSRDEISREFDNRAPHSPDYASCIKVNITEAP